MPAKEQGLWVDANLMSRLHGAKRSTLDASKNAGESERLLHYADVCLGVIKPVKFVSAKPTKKSSKK
jgi:hypothetical protein